MMSDLSTMTNAARAFIDPEAMVHNIQVMRRKAPGSKVMTVVKSDGYGHGLTSVATTLAPYSDAFGVARIEEALTLRQAGITLPIVLLEGFYEADELPLLVEHQLTATVHCDEQVAMLTQATLSSPLSVWLKVDSGMHRLGFEPDQVPGALFALHACDNVAPEIGYLSHFGCADEMDNPITQAQIDTFSRVTEGLPGERSLAASSGTLFWPQSHFDWVRPGICLYGISSRIELTGDALGLKPAMRLTSRVMAVRRLKAGEPVGYGARWRSSRDTLIGVIAIGYGDGYPRSAPDGTPVWLNGREVPLAGRVSMDMITVDLGPDATDKVGDEAVLWGPELPVERIARLVDTIGYELVCQVTGRVPRQYLTNPSPRGMSETQ